MRLALRVRAAMKSASRKILAVGLTTRAGSGGGSSAGSVAVWRCVLTDCGGSAAATFRTPSGARFSTFAAARSAAIRGCGGSITLGVAAAAEAEDVRTGERRMRLALLAPSSSRYMLWPCAPRRDLADDSYTTSSAKAIPNSGASR